MSVKALKVHPIKAADAAAFVKKHHYSGKVAANSQLHFGVFWQDRLQGVLQFGPPIDKRKLIGLVRGTAWNGFLELNRMAFSDVLPRNSESRVIAVSMGLIRKHYPHIEWVVSFSDASQCGDGTIYRASGFVLTQINENRSMIRFPDGEVHASISITNESGASGSLKKRLCQKWGVPWYNGSKVSPFFAIGAEYVEGYQMRYLYFLNEEARTRLTCTTIPFAEIPDGVRMYKGRKLNASEGEESSRPPSKRKKGGASPTLTLQPDPEV
jgi:hypothetical protein